MADALDDEYQIPLRDQRYFGAGIKRKRIQFVPSTSATPAPRSLPTASSQSAADKYLSIVLKSRSAADIQAPETAIVERVHGVPACQGRVSSSNSSDDNQTLSNGEPEQGICQICNRPVTVKRTSLSLSHETSISHQICLSHSHPPSHVDRKRLGLSVLESHGWDPDSRRGLGSEGDGILHPIKASEKLDRAGIGLKAEDAKRLERQRPVKLDAGKIQAADKENKRKAGRLRDAFYRSESVERYLARDEPEEVGRLK